VIEAFGPLCAAQAYPTVPYDGTENKIAPYFNLFYFKAAQAYSAGQSGASESPWRWWWW
jgi:hypothetical protein